MLSDKFVFNKIVQNGETGNDTAKKSKTGVLFTSIILRFKQNTVSKSEPDIATTHRVSFHHTDIELKSEKQSQIKKPTKMGSDNGHTPIWNRSIT